jgi:mono/diheme cytochrome c family protein
MSSGLATALAGPSPAAMGPGTSTETRPIPAAPSAEQVAKLRVASEFYRTNCFACHGLDGTGSLVRPLMTTIPDFTNREWQSSHENAQMAISILDGKGVLMPPWRGRVTPELAQDLIAFVRNFGPPDLARAEAPVSEFGTRFRNLRKQLQELDQQAQALSHP